MYPSEAFYHSLPPKVRSETASKFCWRFFHPEIKWLKFIHVVQFF